MMDWHDYTQAIGLPIQYAPSQPANAELTFEALHLDTDSSRPFCQPQDPLQSSVFNGSALGPEQISVEAYCVQRSKY
jgi:hypothetical protein